MRAVLPIVYGAGRAADAAVITSEEVGGRGGAARIQQEGGEAAAAVVGREEQLAGAVDRHEAGIGAVRRLLSERCQSRARAVESERGDGGRVAVIKLVAAIKDGQGGLRCQVGGTLRGSGGRGRAQLAGLRVPAGAIDAFAGLRAEQDPAGAFRACGR